MSGPVSAVIHPPDRHSVFARSAADGLVGQDVRVRGDDGWVLAGTVTAAVLREDGSILVTVQPCEAKPTENAREAK